MAITNATAGEALRADLDSGGVNRQEVLVTIFVKDPAGGSSAWHTERVYVGDGPAEYIGPLLPENFRKRLIRVRITDVVSGEILADDIDRVG